MATTNTYWTIAERVCTPRQLEALDLHARGHSYRSISWHLGISPERVGQLVRRATQKIELELRKEPAA